MEELVRSGDFFSFSFREVLGFCMLLYFSSSYRWFRVCFIFILCLGGLKVVTYGVVMVLLHVGDDALLGRSVGGVLVGHDLSRADISIY